MTSQADVISALVASLSLNSAITGMVRDRIYGGFDTLDRQDQLPFPAVALRPSGGPQPHGLTNLQKPRVDIVCYGRTAKEADTLSRAVQQHMRVISRESRGDVLMHSAEEDGGPVLGRSQTTNAPNVSTAWCVLASRLN